MKIAVIGTGYVGLVSGTCFAEIGHKVICVDKDISKVELLQAGVIPIYEPDLDVLVKNNVANDRLKFTTIMAEAVAQADAVFIAVGTPPHPDHGHADMKYVYAAVKEVAEHLEGYAVIVNKSTVPVGTGAEVEKIVSAITDSEFSVVSNPEFLREGAAIDDFLNPDRVVVGVCGEQDKVVMAEIYKPLTDKGVAIQFTTRESAELIKYASNAFLATKIGFINEIADLCEKVGASVDEVAHGMGLDTRIGDKFLQAGPGYGGSCFPKDTLALTKTGDDYGVSMSIVEATIKANDDRKLNMAKKIIDACGGSVAGKAICVLGLTFKANTDDMRDGPSLVIVPKLVAAGAKVQAYDPEGMDEAKKHFGDKITYCANMKTAIDASDAIVILTEWDEFKKLDVAEAVASMNVSVIVDLRNIINPALASKVNVKLVQIGLQ